MASLAKNVRAHDHRRGKCSACMTALASFFRGLPLVFCLRPRTPLRVLCLMAFDTLHVFRYSKRLSMERLKTLATVLDFGAAANAFFDEKNFNRDEYRTVRRLIDAASLKEPADDYLRRLRNIELHRPLPGGDELTHQSAQSYREDVVRLSLGFLATTGLGEESVDAGIRATHASHDLLLLFRIVMLCQIIDDVCDYAKDMTNHLPSFLTAHSSLDRSLNLTRTAAIAYGKDLSTDSQMFPFRVALFGVQVLAKVSISLLNIEALLYSSVGFRTFVRVSQSL